MRHGFIGFGNLARAVHEGLIEDSKNSFVCVSKDKKEREIPEVGTIGDVVTNSDVIWLCIKPQDIDIVLEELKHTNLKNKVILSPVAGITVGFLEKYLGVDTLVVRVMPNLAIAYQESVIAFCTNNESRLTQNVKIALEKLGKVVELSESDFDLFTAIFGSGPAFLLKILGVFREKTKDLNITDNVADELLLGLLVGTTKYLQENPTKSIEELIQDITSKGGVTEAGLQHLRGNELSKLFGDIILVAEDKSKQISR